MSLTRTVLGLLLADDFNRADSDSLGGDWTERSGDWDIVSNRAAITDSTSNRFAENDAAAVGTAFGQAILRSDDIDPTGGRTMLVLRFDWNGGSPHGYMMQADGNSDEWRLSLINAGAFTTLAVVAQAFSDDTDYPVQLYVADGVQQGWGGGNTLSGTDTTHDGANARTLAMRFGRNAGTPTGMVDDVIWCRNRSIVVRGLPTGWKAKILNGSETVLSSATESGGTATVRADRAGGCTELVPIAGFAALIITDGSDVEQYRYDAAGVYPGDQYFLGHTFLGTAGHVEDGDYDTADPELKLVWDSHRDIRVTDIGDGRKWTEVPASDPLGMQKRTPSFASSLDIWVGARVKRGQNTGLQEPVIILAKESAGDDSFAVRVHPDGYIRIKQNLDSTVVYDGSVDGSLVPLATEGDEAYIEVHYVRNSSGGAGTATFTVYVDGVLDGSNTISTGLEWEPVTLVEFSSGQNTADDSWPLGWRTADEYVDTAAQRGPCFIRYRPANAAGSSAEFTPSGAATNHAAVDELNGDSDTTYNEGDGDGGAVADQLRHSSLGGAPIAVQPVVRARRTGSAADIRVGLKSGTTEAWGPPAAVGTTYARSLGHVYLLDPDGDVAWTADAGDDVEIGYEAVDMGATAPVRVTQAGLVVMLGPGTPPDTPTITVDDFGPRSITFESSDYSHPDSEDISAVEWVIATDAGFTTGVESVEIEFSSPADVPEPFVYAFGELEPSTQYWGRVRHRDEDGAWSEYSASVSQTTDTESLPTTPSITAANPTATSVALTSSAFADPFGRTHVSSDWQVDEVGGDFSSPVNESLDDVSVLTAENIAGLVAGTAYKARVRHRVDDGTYSNWSAAFNFTTLTTPTNRPAQPTASVTGVTQTGATLLGSAYSDPTGSPHLRTRWYITNYPGGGTFGIAYRVLDVTTSVDLLSRAVTGLEPGTLHHAAVQYQAADGDWSDWSSWVPFTTVAEPLDGQLLQITQPRHGQPIRGTAVEIRWTPASAGLSTFDLEYSADLGATWVPLADGVIESPYEWSVSALIDGVYLIRVRGVSYDDEVTEWQYRIVYVDNQDMQAGETYLFNFNSDQAIPTTLGDWDPAWQETDIAWAIGGGGDVRYTLSAPTPTVSTGAIESAFTFLPAFEPRQVDVIGEVMIGSVGGAFPWNWFPEQAAAGVGVFAVGGIVSGVPENGVAAMIYAVPIAAFGDCELRGSGDGFLEVAWFEDGQRVTSAVVPIGRVHVVNLFAGCNKVPRYGVRLRLTTIADLPGGRRRMRVQASVTGRGVELPENGWHHQTTIETGLDCGLAAFVARNINTTTGPYRSFSNLTVIPYEYGACSAPVGFADAIPLDQCQPIVFDLTIFGDDDVTPLFGSVDGYGAVEEASFSTDPNHPRPWLVAWEMGAEHEVDPIAAASNIGKLVAEVIDKRVDPCDQGSGYLTGAGGDEDGFSAYIGRRAVAREWREDGTYEIVMNGPIMGVTLLDSMVTYRFDISSMREREREVEVFDTQHETMSAYPYGPVNGYGKLLTYSTFEIYLVQPAAVAEGTYVFDTSTDGVRFGRVLNHNIFDYAVHPEMEALGQPEAVFEDNGFTGYVYTQYILKWRRPGDTDWRYLVDMPGPPFPLLSGTTGAAFDFLSLGGVGPVFGLPRLALEQVRLNVYDEDEDQAPISGETIEYQVLANTIPSNAFPFYYDGNFGTLLRHLYDGDFSPADPNVRYDEACMADFEATAPRALLRRVGSSDDMKEWVQKNIYQAIGWLPGLTDEGLICPVDATIPDSAEGLVTLDNALVISASWNQDGTRATPIVEYRFVREWTVLVDEEFFPDVTVYSQPAQVTHISARAGALLKSKALVLAPETIRALGGPLGEAINPELVNDTATLLAAERARTLATSFAFGPQMVPVRVRDTALTRQLVVGTWCILDASWIPNLGVLARGGEQLGMVIRRRRDPGLAWDLTLLLAGPGATGLITPELDTPTVESTQSVCVALTNDPFDDYGTAVVVQFGVGDTEPTSWILAGTMTGPGQEVCTEPQTSGTTIWFRARTERFGYRPSPWSDPVSVAVGATNPALFSLQVTVAPSGRPTVVWTNNPVALGVLIEYEVHAQGTTPTYPDSVEVEASLGQKSLTGETVADGERISVRATPYTDTPPLGGTAGTARTAYADMNEDPVGSGFSSGFDTGFGS